MYFNHHNGGDEGKNSFTFECKLIGLYNIFKDKGTEWEQLVSGKVKSQKLKK